MQKEAKIWYKSKVFEGQKLGRTIGFPTLNLNAGVVPSSLTRGVYASIVQYKNKQYKGALYFGPRVVFQETKDVLEIYLFDFDEMIYDQEVSFCFEKFIRPVKNFSNIEEMKIQLEFDKESVDKYWPLDS